MEAATRSPGTRPSPAVTSSVIPSLKNSSALSGLAFTNGRTAIELGRGSGAAAAGVGVGAVYRSQSVKARRPRTAKEKKAQWGDRRRTVATRSRWTVAPAGGAVCRGGGLVTWATRNYRPLEAPGTSIVAPEPLARSAPEAYCRGQPIVDPAMGGTMRSPGRCRGIPLWIAGTFVLFSCSSFQSALAPAAPLAADSSAPGPAPDSVLRQAIP